MMRVSSLITVEVLILCLAQFIGITSGYTHNSSCSSSIECVPKDTFLRCTKGHCLCAADSIYDFRKGYCRLRINVRCLLTGSGNQPCVKDAYCDLPAFADGEKIQGASTGNCICYRGESIEEDGTCSGANSLQRSFGHRSIVLTPSLKTFILLMFIGICVIGGRLCTFV